MGEWSTKTNTLTLHIVEGKLLAINSGSHCAAIVEIERTFKFQPEDAYSWRLNLPTPDGLEPDYSLAGRVFPYEFGACEVLFMDETD